MNFYADLNGNRIDVGTLSSDHTIRQRVVQRGKLLNFDAYGLDVAYINDAIVYGAVRSKFPVKRGGIGHVGSKPNIRRSLPLLI